MRTILIAMHRNVILLLVGAAYVAGQCAAVPHSHPGEAQGHSARPHVHANWYLAVFGLGSSGHSHPHGHSHDLPLDPKEPADPLAPSDDQDHDQTCVYLSGPGLQATPVKFQISSPYSFTDHAEYRCSPPSSEDYRIAWCIPPPAFGPDRPLFLILRTLRI
jgi:hypothetical protein